MKFFGLLFSLSIFTVLSLSSPIDNKTNGLKSEKTSEIKEAVLDYDYITALPSKENAESNKEVIVSKDNIVPLLRTIILAVTHKQDPTYHEILKLGGKTLFKLAEKKVGSDKHMKGLLTIIKKHVVDYSPSSTNKEEEELLGELAGDYLQKHKFRLLFPESILLHQPEMEVFVNKMKDMGSFEGRQMSFDFNDILTQISNFSVQMRSSLSNSSFSLFDNFNFDTLRNSLSTITSSFDDFMPSIRNAVGNGGLSLGSITALAAAGALISAPFFMSNVRSAFREEDDGYYINRRVSTGGFPPEQFVGQVDGEPMVLRQPEWIKNYEANRKIYAPRTNPHYTEPAFSLYGGENPNENNNEVPSEDEAYSQYLNEYNQWLQQYHNAVNEVPSEDSEYSDYYRKYREWYSKYYNEQFGEELPKYDKVSPSAFEENMNIPNMLPPQQALTDSVPSENIQSVINYAPESPSLVTEVPPNPIEINVASPQFQNTQQTRRNTNFKVIKVEPTKEIEIPSNETPLPEPSPLIDNSMKKDAGERQIYLHRANPRPIYIPTEQDNYVSTEKRPEPTVIIFKKKPSENSLRKEEPSPQLYKQSVAEKENSFSAASSEIQKELPTEAPTERILFTKRTTAQPELKKTVPTKKMIEKSTQSPQTKKPISRVTSGIFRTSPHPTPKFQTTPRPYYQNPIRKSVRVVTSKSVVTPSTSLQKEDILKTPKKKLTLTDLLKKNEDKYSSSESLAKESSTKAEERKDMDIESLIEGDLEDDKLSQRISAPNQDLPIYAMDPFYGPRLSRTDAIFHQLNIQDEACREQVVCNMYKNPNAFTPLSDFLSRQLTVTYDQLTRPNVNDERILRFFKYLRAARAGQDGFDCAKEYPKCYADTTKLSYKPIVSAYNKVSLLMNSSR